MPQTHGSPERSARMPTEHLDDLRARAQYARERYQLYKAKGLGQRPTSAARLRELQRASEQADARLRFAQAEDRRGSEGKDPHHPG
jgi:hypothetical protein